MGQDERYTERNGCYADHTAHQVILDLLARPADDDRVIRYRGMKFTRASLERAIYLYELGIYKYLSIKMPNA